MTATKRGASENLGCKDASTTVSLFRACSGKGGKRRECESQNMPRYGAAGAGDHRGGMTTTGATERLTVASVTLPTSLRRIPA